MASANRTVYALLGLLAQGPKSGYAIKQVVEKTIHHFWKESFGHIYPTLARLAAEGLIVRVGNADVGAKERQPYQITPAGAAALRDWLALPIEPEGVRNELALKLYFGAQVPIAASRAHLEAHRAYHRTRLAHLSGERAALEARRAAGDRLATFELTTLALGLHISSARIAWASEAISYLDALEQAEISAGAV